MRASKYTVRNFLPLMAAAVIPAVIVGLLISPTEPAAFFVDYIRGRGMGQGEFAGYFFGGRVPMYHIYPVILIFLSIVIGGSIIISAIEKHMRVGVMSVRSPLKLFNSGAVPAAITLFIWMLMFLLFRFVAFGLALLINLAFGGVFGLAAVFVIITYAGLLVLFFTLSAPLLLWTPCMMIYGYKFSDAASTSFRMAGKRIRPLILAQIIPVAVLFGARIAAELIFAPVAWPAALIFDILSVLVLLMYFCVLIAVAYFDLAEIERRDIKSISYKL